MQVQENGGSYTLTGITRGGQPLQDDDTVTVTCLATEKQMAPLLQDESRAFERGEATVKDAWSEALSGGSYTLTTGREPRLNGVKPPSQPSTKARTVSFSSAPVMVRRYDRSPLGMIMARAVVWV